MPDGGPELTLITPGRVGRGAGGRPPRAGVGLTTAVILHPRTPVPSPRRGRTRPHRTGAGLTGDKAAITADRLALIAPGSDLSASARGCGSDPLVLRLVPALTWSARSPGNPRGRTSGRRPRGLPGDLADQGTFSRTGQRPWRPFPMQRRGPRGSSLPGGLGTAPRARCVTGYGFPIGIHPGARQCPQRTRRPVPRS